LVTIWFQNRGIGEEVIIIGSLGRRLANAGMAIWWYGEKVIVPARLMAIYPPWKFDSVHIWEWLPLIGIVLCVGLLWYWRNRGTNGAFVAVACFILALAPVLGFLRMAYLRSDTLVADHFVYFADVPLLALIAAAIVRVWSYAQRFVQVVIATLVGGAVLASGIYASTRAAVFHDEETLWHDTLAKNPDAWQAQVRLGQLLFSRQDYPGALPHLESAVRLKPELPDNRNLLGLDYCRLQRFEEGIAEYRKALALEEARSAAERSPVATIRTNLANALTLSANTIDGGAANIPEEARRRYDEAVTQYEKALEIEPEQPAIHRNLGMLLARLGRNDEAIAHLRKTLQLVPNEPTAREVLEEIGAHER
jgi:Tfp pilus assembly protein PilF